MTPRRMPTYDPREPLPAEAEREIRWRLDYVLTNHPPGWSLEQCEARARYLFWMSNWDRLKRAVFERDGFVCQVCGIDEATVCYHAGHIVDRVANGLDTLDNVVVMCEQCNMTKPVHETREEYDAWLADENLETGPHFRRSRALVASILTEMPPHQRAKLDAETREMRREATRRDMREIMAHRRWYLGSPKGRRRLAENQSVMEALWSAGSAGLTLEELRQRLAEDRDFSRYQSRPWAALEIANRLVRRGEAAWRGEVPWQEDRIDALVWPDPPVTEQELDALIDESGSPPPVDFRGFGAPVDGGRIAEWLDRRNDAWLAQQGLNRSAAD